MKIERIAKTASSTERIARDLAKRVRPPLVFLLDGDLGAGKTTFVRGFVRALAGGKGVVVQSPTFALARTYATRPAVHHLDLYRLDDATIASGGLEELGLVELLRDPDAFAFVEWPRELSPPRSVPCARVQLRPVDDDARAIAIEIPDEAVVAAKPRPKATKVRRTATQKRRA